MSHRWQWSTAVFFSLLAMLSGLAHNGWGQTPADRDAEVKVIKWTLDRLEKANQDRNLELILDHYSDDAKIDSKAARAKVSKATFKDALIQNWQREPKLWSEYRGIKISLADATHARAEGTVYIHLTSGSNIVSEHEWKFEKRGERWLIVETNFK